MKDKTEMENYLREQISEMKKEMESFMLWIKFCASAIVLIICCHFYTMLHSTTSSQKVIQPSSCDCPKIQPLKAIDCTDLLNMGNNKSGVYEIWPINRMFHGKPLVVYCDMDTDEGGWTVIQRRGDFKNPIDYFFQDWDSYKEGFGNIEQEFWLGNDNIFALTNQKAYSVRFDLRDFLKEKRYAIYKNFYIDDENHKYTLHISEYAGDAGDSMSMHNNLPFSTKDFDQDSRPDESCAKLFRGAWWYRGCYLANLNGIYQKRKHTTKDGIVWEMWKGNQESLEWTEIKIRPRHFGLCSS